MDIKNLKEGQVVKNYKEMCLVLQEEIKTGGGAKQSQLKDWERYFKWHKQGQKFIIDEIYTEPKEKIDNRKGHSGKSKGSRKQNSIYNKYIKILVLHILAEKYKKNNLNVYISRSKMLHRLNLVNSNFRFANYNRKKLANYLSVDDEIINEFFNLNYQNLNKAVETALKNLQNMDNLISYKIITTVVTQENTRSATKEEEKLIKNIEYETMEEMGYKNMCCIYLEDLYKAFKNKVINKLKEMVGIQGYYKSYDIVFSDYILKAKEQIDQFLLEDDNLLLNKTEINSSVCLNLNKNAENRHMKAKKKSDEVLGKINDEKIIMRANKEYTKDNRRIINMVIDENANDVSMVMQKAWEEKEEQIKDDIDKQLDEIFG